MDPDLRVRLIAAFRWIDPGPHSSHLVSDRSGWWRDPVLLREVGPALATLFPHDRPSVVISPAVTGFLVGPLVAHALGVGFVEAYRADPDRRIAGPMCWADTDPDHRGRRLRLGLRERHVTPTDRILLVDDWVATGAQLRALRVVLSTLGAGIVGTAAIVAECSERVRDELTVRSLLRGPDLDAAACVRSSPDR